MSADLVARLRARSEGCGYADDVLLMRDAADALERAQQEITERAETEEALTLEVEAYIGKLERAEAERDAATLAFAAARDTAHDFEDRLTTADNKLHAAEAIASAARALATFGLACLDEARKELGDLDGGWVQDTAEKLGVLTPHEVTEPCDPEHCVCAEYGFPTTCYRDSEATKACRAALAAVESKP